jgi:hypothetical protein
MFVVSARSPESLLGFAITKTNYARSRSQSNADGERMVFETLSESEFTSDNPTAEPSQVVNEPTIDFEALVDSYLEPVTNSLMAMWYPSQFRLPAFIHHYTTASSLQSIIVHHELWATDARYLNDSRELVHAEELIATALQEAASRISNEWASRFISEAMLHSKPLLIFWRTARPLRSFFL